LFRASSAERRKGWVSIRDGATTPPTRGISCCRRQLLPPAGIYDDSDRWRWIVRRSEAGKRRDRRFADETRAPKCDISTATHADIDRGAVNIRVRFHPLRPPEFVLIRLRPADRS
jgi:hypothetical protein